MKIGFYTLSAGHEVRGIGFYTKNLKEELLKLPDVEVTEIENSEQLKSVALVHYPFFDLFKVSLPEENKIPTVVTVHDVTPLLFPKNYQRGLKGEINFKKQKQSLKRVDAVITDSLSSKNDIERCLGVPKDKIFPIYLAPAKHYKKITNQNLLSQVRQKYKLPKRFVLFVGDVNYNKNIINTIKAAREAGLPLVIVGKQAKEMEDLLSGFKTQGPRDIVRKILKKPHPELSHFQEVLNLIKNKDDVIRLGFIPDDELVDIYNLAEILVMPSLYEGFGLPVLESQACGTPVVTSNISSLPEVVGDSALLVDPYNSSEIAEAIKDIINKKDLRDSLIKRGFENIKRFSWKKTAKETLKVYEKVLQ